MKKKVVVVLGVSLLMALCCLMSPVLTYLFILVPNQVTGQSMEPTLNDGDFILSNRLASPKVGDIVVYDNEKFQQIGRIVAQEDDKIKIEEGVLYINGEEENQDSYGLRIVDPTNGGSEILEDEGYTVPQGSYFILGDNRAHSSDSRFNGFVNEDKIIGVYFLTYKEAQN